MGIASRTLASVSIFPIGLKWVVESGYVEPDPADPDISMREPFRAA